MLIGKPADVRSSEITDERLYLDRRRFLGRAGAIGLATAASALAGSTLLQACARPDGGGDAEDTTTASGAVVDTPTPYKDVTGYNNFYEFGTDKTDPAANSLFAEA